MTEHERLLDRIVEIEQLADQRWVEGLEDRKKKELEFADSRRGTSKEKLDQDTYEKFYGNQKYYVAHRLSKDYFDQWLARHARGKVVLDYCCGDGDNAIKAARAGAALAIGIDISRVSIEGARRDAERKGVGANTRFLQGDAENTHLPDGSVDTVICCGVLHHLDLSYAMPELRRIMKPGARLIAIEALDYNPVIKFYRTITPAMRTEWEKAHILSLKDVTFASRFFEVGEVRYWHMTSILGAHLRPLMPLLNAVDSALTRVPGLQLMAWIFTFELIKPPPRK